MENTELSHLQKEIALRGRIIETLVSANEELRHKCSHLVSFLVSKTANYSPAEKEWLQNMVPGWLDENGMDANTNTYAYSDNGNGANTDTYSLAEKGKVADTHTYSTAEKGKAADTDTCSTTEKGNGTNTHTYSIAEKEKVANTNTYSTTEKWDGINTHTYSTAENGNGINTQQRPLPAKLEAGKYSEFNLYQKIKQHTKHKGRRSATSATASLLVHIYNGGDCGYPTLKKVTHLSTGGLGKMLMRLTKKGLIKRTGLQKLALTENALSLLQHTWTETGR